MKPLASIWHDKTSTVPRELGVLWTPDETVPWQFWSEKARAIVHELGWLQVYEAMNSRQRSWDEGLIQSDYGEWYRPASPSDHVTDKTFLSEMGNALLECERCGRMYDQELRPAGPSSYIGVTPTFQMSFTFCPSNDSGDCHQQPTPAWKRRQTQVELHYHSAARETMDTLSRLNPAMLIYTVFGDLPSLNGEEELIAAYKALRVIWVRAFPALRETSRHNQSTPSGSMPTPSPEASNPNEQDGTGRNLEAVALLHQVGHVLLWGEMSFDYMLCVTGLVSEEDIAYLYGVSGWTQAHLLASGWTHEMEWLNAYAGLRHRVPHDHYMLMRTACQRVYTAMDRYLQVLCLGAQVDAQHTKHYALNGRRFHELLSAMCADMDVVRQGRRAFDQPLRPGWWKQRSTEVNGRRVERAIIFWS